MRLTLLKVADVARSGDAVAGLHAAHLARGTQEAVSHLLDSEAFFDAVRAEQDA
jgi:hypothetical protein